MTRDGGYELAAQLQDHLATTPATEDLPLCVFAPADVMALGALGELRRRGIDVPGEVSVAGFGGVPDGGASNPSVTTIALPLHEMARQAVQWVLDQAPSDAEAAAADVDDVAQGGDSSTFAPSEVHVRGDVQLRESTSLTARA